MRAGLCQCEAYDVRNMPCAAVQTPPVWSQDPHAGCCGPQDSTLPAAGKIPALSLACRPSPPSQPTPTRPPSLPLQPSGSYPILHTQYAPLTLRTPLPAAAAALPGFAAAATQPSPPLAAAPGSPAPGSLPPPPTAAVRPSPYGPPARVAVRPGPRRTDMFPGSRPLGR